MNRIPAGVLLLLFTAQKEASSFITFSLDETDCKIPLDSKILFTIRSQTVAHHKGQISFPGGMQDQADLDLLATALRETEEEVGIPPHLIRVLGKLPETPTISSPFTISPFIGVLEENEIALQVSSHEIDDVLFVPLKHLLDEKNSKIELFKRDEVKIKLRSYFYEGHRIWGATAFILEKFLNRCS